MPGPLMDSMPHHSVSFWILLIYFITFLTIVGNILVIIRIVTHDDIKTSRANRFNIHISNLKLIMISILGLCCPCLPLTSAWLCL